MSDLAEEVVDAANEIMDTIDNDSAYSFAESIKEKAQSIGATVVSMQEKGVDAPTPAQTLALQNMLTGAERWLENRRD